MYIASNPPTAKLLIASWGVSTKGSPARLKEVFIISPSPFRSLKDRLQGKKLYTALARKLARIVWSVWCNNGPYEPK
jgi:hypothetical protein